MTGKSLDRKIFVIGITESLVISWRRDTHLMQRTYLNKHKQFHYMPVSIQNLACPQVRQYGRYRCFDFFVSFALLAGMARLSAGVTGGMQRRRCMQVVAFP
jgi:hypothetical protein